jgi:CheY-like chemotaxis protein
VRDTGIGISEDLLPRVFELFVQAERSLDRSQGGLGIGLTMVKRLVELHGGVVEARSGGPGRGSEFEVRIAGAEVDRAEPVDAKRPSSSEGGAAEAAPPRAPEPPPSPKGRVLVIEDNPDAAQTLRDLLVRWGYQVFHASDGEGGIRMAQDAQPHAVLIDIGLPGMDGFEVARRLRERLGQSGQVPVLIGVTGYGQAQDRRLSREAGIDHHLVKPLDPAALRVLLSRCCGGPAAS